MPDEIQRIGELLKQLFDGPMWHGPNLRQAIEGIDAPAAYRAPAAGSHTIYQLVLHLAAWRRFVLEMVRGNHAFAIAVDSEADWVRTTPAGPGDWERALAGLQATQADLVPAIAAFPAGRLEEKIPGKSFTFYALLHGLIHHDLYHAAQIQILKKGKPRQPA